MSKRTPLLAVLRYAVLALGLVLAGLGLAVTRRVYEADSAGWGMQVFQDISDRQLTIDATFGGVARRDGRLVSTYDRTDTRGKRACPT